MEKARSAVLSVEKEISSIKQGLTRLSSSTSEEIPNRIALRYLRSENDSEKHTGKLKVQCSNPMQSQCIDLTNTHNDDALLEFSEVEFSDAVFTAQLSLLDDDGDDDTTTNRNMSWIQEGDEWSEVLLGDDNVLEEFRLDVGTLECSSNTREITLLLVPSSRHESDDNEKVDENVEKEQEEDDNNDDDEEEQLLKLKFEIQLHPGTQDKLDKLYDMLAKASKKKAAAINELRRAAAAFEDSNSSNTNNSNNKVISKSAAVKPGFLNSGDGKDNKGFVSVLVDRAQQWGTRFTSWFVLTKDYGLFFGSVVLIHYYGEALALPPPV